MKEKEFKWGVIRVDGITIAQGYKCPHCGLININPSCQCSEKEKDHER